MDGAPLIVAATLIVVIVQRRRPSKIDLEIESDPYDSFYLNDTWTLQMDTKFTVSDVPRSDQSKRNNSQILFHHQRQFCRLSYPLTNKTISMGEMIGNLTLSTNPTFVYLWNFESSARIIDTTSTFQKSSEHGTFNNIAPHSTTARHEIWNYTVLEMKRILLLYFWAGSHLCQNAQNFHRAVYRYYCLKQF